MVFRDDRRAQSTLIGFVLLFGILIVAFSSYQAVVVPAQNAQVEYNHNSEVQTDLQELRNSLLDVRSVERIDGDQYAIVSEHRPTSVQLGTSYPARLIALNPPQASGRIRTIDPTTDVQIENANVNDTAASNLGGNLSALFAAHETRFLTYEPNYNEYQTAPTTVLEHSLLYNDFSEANVTVQDQTVLNTSGNRITIVLFNGTISRSSAEAVTLDPQTLDGPTAPVPIEPQAGENITLRLPTSSLDAWEQSIGDLSGAQINDTASSDIEVVIELQGDQYDLRMTRVGFDGGSVGEKQFTPIQYEAGGAAGGGGGGGVTPAYNISWDAISMDREDEFTCPTGTDRCEIETGQSGRVFVQTPDRVGGFAEFAVANAGVGNFTRYSSEFENDILLPDPVEFTAGDSLGETSVFVFAGDGRDELTVEITGLAVQITGTNSPVTEGETLDVTTEVENTGSTSVTRTLELEIEGEGVVATQEVTVGPGATESRTLSWTTQTGDAGDYTATVSSGDDSDTTNVTVVAADAPEFTSIEVTSAGQGQNNNELTFAYETTTDATGVTLFAESSAGTELVNDSTAPTDTTGVTYAFNNVNMNNNDINIEMTARDGDGNSRTCTGTITTQGGSTSLSEMTCSIN